MITIETMQARIHPIVYTIRINEYELVHIWDDPAHKEIMRRDRARTKGMVRQERISFMKGGSDENEN